MSEEPDAADFSPDAFFATLSGVPAGIREQLDLRTGLSWDYLNRATTLVDMCWLLCHDSDTDALRRRIHDALRRFETYSEYCLIRADQDIPSSDDEGRTLEVERIAGLVAGGHPRTPALDGIALALRDIGAMDAFPSMRIVTMIRLALAQMTMVLEGDARTEKRVARVLAWLEYL